MRPQRVLQRQLAFYLIYTKVQTRKISFVFFTMSPLKTFEFDTPVFTPFPSSIMVFVYLDLISQLVEQLRIEQLRMERTSTDNCQPG